MSNSENPNKKPNTNPYYIDGTHFDPELYMQHTFKTSNLRQLMDFESEIVTETLTLHSDMQTLVYENYNKFISATDTVRKMKTDFKKMEDEMELLASNMESITSFSESISSILQDSHHQISRLSGIHSLLKRLQFLFKLPSKLKTQMQYKNYSQAVQDYLHIQRVLEQYGNLESFQGIQQECNEILEELKQKLWDQFNCKYATAKELAESVDLLLQLKEPQRTLCNEFLTHAESRLSEKLTELGEASCQDLLEYAGLGNKFVDDLCVIVCSYNDMFVNRENMMIDNASSILSTFINSIIKQYFDQIQTKLDSQQDSGECSLLAHSLDKFYRKLCAVKTLLGSSDYLETFIDMIIRSGRRQCRYHLHVLKFYLTESLSRVRQTLASPKLITASSSEVSNSGLTTELLTQLVLAVVEKVKRVLEDLMPFVQPSSLTFSSKPRFREAFCVDSVREGLVVGFIHHLTATARSFSINLISAPSLPLLLILSKMCLEFEATNVHYLLRLTDKLFEMETKDENPLLTAEEEMCAGMRIAAQNLLNHYVRMQGLAISQMLRKSVETRDWLHSLEPRTVRAVMKRVMEEMAAVETQVGLLFEEGSRPERSSDSSRKTHSRQHRSTTSNWSSHSIAASHIHKLFSEKIEILSPVEFSKVSILTGIIKISLKTLLECVRLRTFSRYGLQQIQVDTHYLQLYLWRFVADENLVHFFLDEILSSSINRCLDAVLMEPSVVEIICERG